MNREILFRAKQLDTGEWKEGSLIDGLFKNPVILNDTDKNVIRFGAPSDLIMADPDTVCQYTGIKDRINKSKIFENDIVLVDGMEYYGLVRFGSYAGSARSADFNYGWYIEWLPDPGYCRHDFGYWINKMVVIGNYFDNPELLEGPERRAAGYAHAGTLQPAT